MAKLRDHCCPNPDCRSREFTANGKDDLAGNPVSICTVCGWTGSLAQMAKIINPTDAPRRKLAQNGWEAWQCSECRAVVTNQQGVWCELTGHVHEHQNSTHEWRAFVPLGVIGRDAAAGYIARQGDFLPIAPTAVNFGGRACPYCLATGGVELNFKSDEDFRCTRCNRLWSV